MMNQRTLPGILEDTLGSEERGFVVKEGGERPLFQSLGLLLLGLFWTGFVCVFSVRVLGPLFLGKTTQFEINGAPVIAGPGQLAPVILPSIFLGVFFVIGILLLVRGISSLRKKGVYVAGTPYRLVLFRNGKLRSIDWKAFSGEVHVRGSNDLGTVSLHMRRRYKAGSRAGVSRHAAGRIRLRRIPNALDVERYCRQRIRENNPDL